MARYIDANKMIDKLEEIQFDAPVMTPVMKIYNVIELVEDQPTAEVAEVRHGEWIDRDGKTWCSLCQASNKQYKPPYCPHCGARMDGDEE